MNFKCASKSQVRHREVGSKGSETANPRADEQKSRRRPGTRMSEPSITKSTEEGFRVNEAVAGRKIRYLPGEISNPCLRRNLKARNLATGFVSLEKSAEGIVADRHP
jgi:hypothetical protein